MKAMNEDMSCEHGLYLLNGDRGMVNYRLECVTGIHMDHPGARRVHPDDSLDM